MPRQIIAASAPAPKKVSTDIITAEFDPQTDPVEAGVPDYAADGAATYLINNDSKCTTYLVGLWVNSRGHRLTVCTCPAYRKCHHIVAALKEQGWIELEQPNE